MQKHIQFNCISKDFPGVKALNNVSFRVESGKVTALLGENGAGKSTLLKILSGYIKPDEGTLCINGEVKHFSNPNEALKASISVIYQERQLVPMMSVMENLFIEDMPSNKAGLLNRKSMRAECQKIIDTFELLLDPEEQVGRLPVAYQQMVEIMKAYRRDSLIIAFDEPTAPLTDAEIEILFRLISQLKEMGKIIIYVSHRLKEIFRVSDTIVVLKDGCLVKTFNTTETSEHELVTAMVGRDIGDTYANLRRNSEQGDILLDVKGLETKKLHDVSFSLRRGEVLGFAGLVGAGRTEVVRAVFGADPVISGEIWLNGELMNFKSPHDAIRHGIALCPEDRKEQGLIMLRSISNNISMPVLKKVKKGIFINRSKETMLALETKEKYDIRTPSTEKLVMELSGGNQQKVILGRWTSSALNVDVLILDEPTKGIDVGTKAEIYQMICDYAKQGKGVIFISSELTEVLNICDNIIVLRNGSITGKMTRQEATEKSVLALAMLD